MNALELLASVGGGGAGGVAGVGTVGGGEQRRQEVMLNGRAVTLRALTAFETQRLKNLRPRPSPPPTREPGTHPTTGPIFYNEADEQYRRRLAEWVFRLQVLQVAAAMDLEVSTSAYSRTMSEDALRRWAEQAVDALAGPGSPLTQSEIFAAWDVVERLSDPLADDPGQDAIANAKKALSRLSRAQAEALIRELYQTGTD